jgi:magnesium-transporting ATPase (P-type)
MITGDHALTASAIAAQLGIGDGTRAVTGRELDDLDDDALERVVAETTCSPAPAPSTSSSCSRRCSGAARSPP